MEGKGLKSIINQDFLQVSEKKTKHIIIQWTKGNKDTIHNRIHNRRNSHQIRKKKIKRMGNTSVGEGMEKLSMLRHLYLLSVLLIT